MGRPSRVPDQKLLGLVRTHLGPGGKSVRFLAESIGVQPSTLTRSIKEGAFSARLSIMLYAELDQDQQKSSNNLVHKALLLLRKSDSLRFRAERLLAEALDRSDLKG